MRVRREGVWRVERGWVENVMVPVVGGWRFRSREAIVDLPDPEAPTRAVVVLGKRVRLRDERMGTVGRVG